MEAASQRVTRDASALAPKLVLSCGNPVGGPVTRDACDAFLNLSNPAYAHAHTRMAGEPRKTRHASRDLDGGAR